MTDESSESEIENISVGETLRQAREAASYSIAYVSGQTHLPEEVIVALENNQFEELAGEVFVRGYIRSYARLLEIDAQPLIDACGFSDSSAPKTATQRVAVRKKLKSSGVDPIVMWSSVTVITLLVGLLATWWINQDQEDPVQLAAVVEQVDPVQISEQRDEQSKNEHDSQHQVNLGGLDPKHVSVVQNEMPDIADSEQLVEGESELEENVDNQVEIIEAPLSGGNIDKVRITVKFTEESWTEIFDARKRRLLHGLIKPGATRVIFGQAPFNVFLGNSPGVQFEINGKPFDHSVYVRRNNTARFLIDDTSS